VNKLEKKNQFPDLASKQGKKEKNKLKFRRILVFDKKKERLTTYLKPWRRKPRERGVGVRMEEEIINCAEL
jgi:uncharacterized hydantoinase/oxoprolinase family protein